MSSTAHTTRTMFRSGSVAAAAVLAVAVASMAADVEGSTGSGQTSPPNVVFVVGDDVGSSDF